MTSTRKYNYKDVEMLLNLKLTRSLTGNLVDLSMAAQHGQLTMPWH